mmetsp:Transcript_25097/g.56067  ORF Transcript_25097/g.56067 Transcript_25097/m.56067 type:complete len:234 (-) Transcript_25097:59-760(-)
MCSASRHGSSIPVPPIRTPKNSPGGGRGSRTTRRISGSNRRPPGPSPSWAAGRPTGSPACGRGRCRRRFSGCSGCSGPPLAPCPAGAAWGSWNHRIPSFSCLREQCGRAGVFLPEPFVSGLPASPCPLLFRNFCCCWRDFSIFSFFSFCFFGFAKSRLPPVSIWDLRGKNVCCVGALKEATLLILFEASTATTATTEMEHNAGNFTIDRVIVKISRSVGILFGCCTQLSLSLS